MQRECSGKKKLANILVHLRNAFFVIATTTRDDLHVSLSAESKWEELHPGGERPPALQEHSAVAYKDCLYVFGGELGFSAGTETPLWVYNVKVTICEFLYV